MSIATRLVMAILAAAGLVAAVPAVGYPAGLAAQFDPRIDFRKIPPVSQWTQPRWLQRAVIGPQSRFAYAKQCAADVGVIPDYHCLDGERIPITVNKVEAFDQVPADGCDNPVKLDTQHGQCIPFSRLVDLSPPSRPEVTIMAICRKYWPATGSQAEKAANATFHDLAIVAHSSKTGATCFFQSKPDQAVDGTTVPSPMADTPAAKAVWLEPRQDPATGMVSYTAPFTGNPGVVVGIDCTNCHDTDPFILSPWIAQVADTDKWDPRGKYNVDRHGIFSPVDGRRWSTRTEGTAPARTLTGCTGCHRMGSKSFRLIGSNPGGLWVNGKINFHGFMPFGEALDPVPWATKYDVVLAQYVACLPPYPGVTPPADCDVIRAGTKTK